MCVCARAANSGYLFEKKNREKTFKDSSDVSLFLCYIFYFIEVEGERFSFPPIMGCCILNTFIQQAWAVERTSSPAYSLQSTVSILSVNQGIENLKFVFRMMFFWMYEYVMCHTTTRRYLNTFRSFESVNQTDRTSWKWWEFWSGA